MCGQVLMGKYIAACRTAVGLLLVSCTCAENDACGHHMPANDGVMAHGLSIDSSSPAAWVGYPCCGKLLVCERRVVQIGMYCAKYRD